MAASADPLTVERQVRYKEKATDPACVVLLTVRYRSASHGGYAHARIIYSFGELALEREDSASPLPGASIAWALYDLVVLNFASDCDNRLKWARMMVDDYHGRFPDDADLEVDTSRSLPKRFLEDALFLRLKPINKIAECTVTFRLNDAGDDTGGDAWSRLRHATNDVRNLRADPGFEVLWFADGKNELSNERPRVWVAVFLNDCDRKHELLHEVLERHAVIFPDVVGFTIDREVMLPSSEFEHMGGYFFRDTREGFDRYLPPRHDVR